VKNYIFKQYDVTILLWPMTLYFLGFFLPISAKFHNNFFYIIVLIPFVLWVRKDFLFRIFTSKVVQLSAIFTIYLAARSLFYLPEDHLKYFDPLRHLFSFAVFSVVCTEFFRRNLLFDKIKLVAIWASGWGAFWAYRFYGQHPLSTRLQYVGPTNHEILGACVYAAVAIFAIYCKTKYRIVDYVSLSLLILVVLLSGSRGPFFSLIVAILVASFFSKKKLLVVNFLLIAGIYLLNCFYNVGFSRIFLATSSYRLKIWMQVLVDSLEQNTWLFGNSLLAPHEVNVNGTIFYHAHSGYMATYFQGGVVALAILLLLIYVCAINIFNRRYTEMKLINLALFVFALLSISTDSHMLLDAPGEVWFYFWMPLLCIAAHEINMRGYSNVAN